MLEAAEDYLHGLFLIHSSHPADRHVEGFIVVFLSFGDIGQGIAKLIQDANHCS
jgi:hypothetical protein